MPAARLLVIVAMVGLAGCGGTGGSSGAPPPPGAVTPIADADEIIASISSVRIKDGTELRFRLRDGADRPVVGLPAGAVSFVLARLTPAANGEPGAWQSYINVTEMPG
ncbi:MAG: hypothetical protein OEW88_08235, partial [Gammaproteobacteria bacterium]|nr:hypothetical protein [Gammaproteobacteria bacterium]